MLFGFCPFQSKCIASLITSLEENDLKIPTNLNDISSQTYKLLTSMLCKDPNKRITWEALFAL
jgi:serine/threonine-protein kinase ULK/ATG1